MPRPTEIGIAAGQEGWRLKLGAHTVLVKGREGLFLANPNDVYVGRALLRYGEYNRYEAELLKQLCGTDDVVVEVGANVGSHSVGLAKQVGPGGRLVAVEPQAEVFQALCANVALNGLHNVDCLQCALGEEPGTLNVRPQDYEREGNFGAVSLGVADGSPVAVFRLDDVFRYDRLRLLKIDVEGMEAEVLRGASETIKRLRPMLYVENDRPDRSYALITLIRDMGYRLWWHIPPLYHPENFFEEKEDDYPNTSSFNMLCVPTEFGTAIEVLEEITDPSLHPLRR